MASDKKIEYEITGDATSFSKAMEGAAKSATSAADTINAQFKKMGDVVSTVNQYMMGFTAVLAGGGALKSFISNANEWNGTAAKMASQLGITTEQASILNVALSRLGIDSDLYTSASQKLSKQIHSNAQAFDVLGVAVRDTTTGAYRPVTEVMGEVNQKLAEIKNPIEQNIAGQQVYGKSWSEIRSILRLTQEQMAESEKRARDLGLIVGPQGAAQSKQYAAQMRDLNLVGKSLEVQFGNLLLPVFAQTGAWLAGEGPTAAKGFGYALRAVADVAVGLFGALKLIGTAIAGLSAAAVALVHGNVAGAKEALSGMADDITAVIDKYDDFREKLWSDAKKPGAVPTDQAPGNSPQYHFGQQGEDPQQKSRMGDWEAALADRKAAIEREGLAENQMRQMSKADELAYWSSLRQQPALTMAERQALTRRTAEVEMATIRENFTVRVATLNAEAAQYKNNTDERLRLEQQVQSHYAEGTKEFADSQRRINEIERQASEQSKRIAESKLDVERSSRLSAIAVEEQASQVAVQLGSATQAQLISAQIGFEQRRQAIASEALQARVQDALRDPDRNPVLLQQLYAEQVQLEQQYGQRLRQLRSALTIQLAQPMVAVTQTMQQGWEQLINGIINRTQSLRQLLGGIFRNILASYVQEMVTKPLAMAATRAVQESSIFQSMFVTQKGLQIAGAATTASTKAAEADAVVTANAVEAASGAAASQASIPWVGPVLAIAAFAAIMSMVMGSRSSIKSAAGGYDIPSNVNPMVQLHANEMVLPAKHADVIRGLADGSQAGQRTTGDVHVNVKGGSAGDFLLVHRAELARAIKAAHRDGMFSGTRA